MKKFGVSGVKLLTVFAAVALVAVAPLSVVAADEGKTSGDTDSIVADDGKPSGDTDPFKGLSTLIGKETPNELVNGSGKAELNLAPNGDGEKDGFRASGIVDGKVTTDTEAKANSTAEFEVLPEYLTLDAVPDMNFGTRRVQDVLNQKNTLTLKQNNVKQKDQKSKNNVAFDGNNAGLLQVTDYRGNNAGWSVQAQLSGFENAEHPGAADNTILGGSLKLVWENVTNSLDESLKAEIQDGVELTSDVQKANDSVGSAQPQTVWNAAVDHGQGTNKATLKLADTTLTLNRNFHALSGNYQATIRWTLKNAPDPALNSATDTQENQNAVDEG